LTLKSVLEKEELLELLIFLSFGCCKKTKLGVKVLQRMYGNSEDSLLMIIVGLMLINTLFSTFKWLEEQLDN